jgi:two-component system, OmpR family, heavy metal sensor histidine kinase CusS
LKNVSISVRLTFWLSSIFLAGFILFGLIMWLDLGYSLSQGRDRTFTRRAARFLEVLEATRADPWQSRQEKLKQLADAIPEGEFMQVLASSGERLFPESASPAGFPWPPLENNTRDPYRDVTYRGRPFRIFTHPVQAERPYMIRVAGQLEDNRNMMARFTTGLVSAIPAMLLLSALAGYFLSRRVLQPVDQITGALRSISIGNLSQRLPVSSTGDELQRLADTCNGMLGRLEGAVERINRFTADASHELRSPVALVRTVAEYALRNPNMDQESREAFETTC